MKVYIDTSVLADLISNDKKSNHNVSTKLVKNLIKSFDYDLWISAISLFYVNEKLYKQYGEDNANDILNFIDENFAIIPLRNSTFRDAMFYNNGVFKDNVELVSAKSFGIDFFISLYPDKYSKNSIPMFTPSRFIEKWENGKLDTSKKIPFLDIPAQYNKIYNEIDDSITDIIVKSGFILGEHVEKFELSFAEIQEAEYCIAVSSGTDALHIAMMAMGIGHGDSVLIPVNTFFATAEAVSLTGAEPEFVDCDEYFNIDIRKLEDKIIELKEQKYRKLKAIIPVHLYGQPANMESISKIAEKYNLKILEDCCQAHLSEFNKKRVGNFGSFGAFSFYPGKNLGAFGEAGALITNDKELYENAKMIRQHGEVKRYNHQIIGHNYRMEAIQGSVLNVKLKYLEDWTQKRRSNAEIYNEKLAFIDKIKTPKELSHSLSVYHLYVIRYEGRDGLQKYLNENGISTGLHYPIPLHLQAAYRYKANVKDDFPVAMKYAKEILSLPMYPELTEKQISFVCKKIKNYTMTH